MKMGYAVKWKGEDEDTLARVTQLKVGAKTIETPRRAMTLHHRDPLCEATEVKDASCRGIIEHVRNLSFDKLMALATDEDARADFEDELTRALGRVAGTKDLTMVHFNFTDGAKGLDDTDVVNVLCDLLSLPRNDILVASVPEGVTDVGVATKMLSRLKAINDVKGERPIMGVIPKTSRPATRKILAAYEKAGIDLFALDLQNKKPLYSTMTETQILLRQYHKTTGRDLFVHAFNVPAKSGNAGIAPVLDLPFIGLGVDSFGKSHVPPKGGGGGAPDPKKERARVRILRTSDYGYLNQAAVELALDNSEPMDWDSSFAKGYDLVKLYKKEPIKTLKHVVAMHNVEKTGREVERIRKVTLKGDLLSYLKGKEHSADDVAEIASVSKKVQTQKSL